MPKGHSLKMTAYHEAGHAVMAYVLHRRIKEVTIIPKDGTLGVLTQGKGPEMESTEYEQTTKARTKLERLAMISCAGNVAECILTGRRHRAGSGTDMSHLFDYITSMSSSDMEEMEAYANWLWYRTRSALRTPWYWSAVESVADELLSKKKLSGEYIRQIIRNDIQRYVRNTSTGASLLEVQR